MRDLGKEHEMEMDERRAAEKKRNQDRGTGEKDRG
eukprot:gene2089-9277_t